MIITAVNGCQKVEGISIHLLLVVNRCTESTKSAVYIKK